MATPFCPHFSRCGGCASQNIAYEDQLLEKHKVVAKAFNESGIDFPIDPVSPSPKTRFYRNRMDFVVWPPQILGLREKGKWNQVIDIKKCFIFTEDSDHILEILRSHFKKHNLTAYDQKTKQGFLRYAVIRAAKFTQDKMITLVTNSGDIPGLDELESHLRPLNIVSFYQSINEGIADTSSGAPKLLWGKPYITEEIQNLKFSITPNCFFQTNPYQASELFQYVKEKVRTLKPRTLMDLYCGVGAFSLILSDTVEQITGIEAVGDSIEMGRFNKEQNKISNVTLLAGDVEVILDNHKEDVDIILVDPPRGGLSKKARMHIQRIRPPNLIYVSCNPNTLAQDIAQLGMYKIKSIRPFDLFPHTPHVECVVALTLK